ncbi:MAG: SRPBCC family protein [Bacteroidota bacterium]
MKGVNFLVALILIVAGTTVYGQDNIIKSGALIVYTTNVPAQKVWDIIGAVDGLDKWFAPVIKTCSVSGDKRTCGIDGDLTFDEMILLVDHKNMIFQYSIPTQPMIQMTDLMATMSVLVDNKGNGVIVWHGTYNVAKPKEAEVKEMLVGAWMMGAKGIETYILTTKK